MGADTSYCEGGSAVITVTGGGGTAPYIYTWLCNSGDCFLDDNSAQSPTANPPTSTVYYAQATDANGCTSLVDSLTVTVHTNPVVNAGADVTIAPEESTTFTPTPTGAALYDWTPSTGLDDATIENPTATPDATTTYVVTVTDSNGCIGDDDVTVTVLDVELEIPTGFTPDGDGANDLFTITNSVNYPEIRVEIYNQWGNLIFESDGYLEAWDGTYDGQAMPTGSYYYVVDLKDDVTEPFTGIITIIR
jgi:gliding motility-associated-like protein